MIIRIAAACAAIAFALPASAQLAASVLPTIVAIPSPATTNAVPRAGTPVALRILEEVTTKERKARVGQRMRMEVASPVEYNGVVVIPAGSPAEAEITSVRNKGMWASPATSRRARCGRGSTAARSASRARSTTRASPAPAPCCRWAVKWRASWTETSSSQSVPPRGPLQWQ